MNENELRNYLKILLSHSLTHSTNAQPFTDQSLETLRLIYSLKMAAVAMLLDKKTVHRLGGQVSEATASKPSAYAMKLMEKMGWREGQGLGKDQTGITKHISIH